MVSPYSLIPDAACASDWCRLRAPRRGDESPCTCHKFSSRLPELSFQLLFPCRESYDSQTKLKLFVPVYNPAARQVVRRKLDGHLIAGQNADEVLAHFAGDVRQHLVLVLQLHAEHRIRQRLD